MLRLTRRHPSRVLFVVSISSLDIETQAFMRWRNPCVAHRQAAIVGVSECSSLSIEPALYYEKQREKKTGKGRTMNLNAVVAYY